MPNPIIQVIMKFSPYLPVAILLASFAQTSAQDEQTIILDETGVKNLGLETVMVEERDFESTVFAIGRVEEIPGNQHAVSSRIPGRAIEVNAFVGDRVEKGQTLVKVESRQPGNPPPIIELKALRDGLVVESHVLEGQPVGPDTELFDISDRSEMWVVARIPEQMAAGIAPGTKARIRIPALGGETINSELIRFGVNADREAGAIEGIFRVPNPDGRLQPGMRAEFDLIVSTRPNVLAVPEEAVQGDPASRVVYAKHFELTNAFIKAPIVAGEKGGGWIEVKEGLFPGDEVVTEGAYMLGFADGGSISLKEALDAAHGHEHAEDGTDLKPEDLAEEENTDHGHAHEGGAPTWLIYYAGSITILLIVFAQLWWNLKRKGTIHA